MMKLFKIIKLTFFSILIVNVSNSFSGELSDRFISGDRHSITIPHSEHIIHRERLDDFAGAPGYETHVRSTIKKRGDSVVVISRERTVPTPKTRARELRRNIFGK